MSDFNDELYFVKDRLQTKPTVMPPRYTGNWFKYAWCQLMHLRYQRVIKFYANSRLLCKCDRCG